MGDEDFHFKLQTSHLTITQHKANIVSIKAKQTLVKQTTSKLMSLRMLRTGPVLDWRSRRLIVFIVSGSANFAVPS